MTSPPRAERLRTAVSLLLLIFAAAAGARAAEPDAAPWNAAPFSAEPSAMLKAADALSLSGAPGVIVLAENVSFVYDATGRRDTKSRLVYRILSAAALKGWSSYEESWASWFQDKPQMRARVITAEGQALTLDPSTISDSPAQPDSPEVYTDRRVLRAPLPGVAVGAIIEEETVIHGNVDIPVDRHPVLDRRGAHSRTLPLAASHSSALDHILLASSGATQARHQLELTSR